jgi:hypothetical protein
VPEVRRKPRPGLAWGFAAALVVLSPSSAWAVQVGLQARVGWDGWVKYGTWNPVVVDVSAAEEFQGWLEVEVTQEFGTQRVQLRAPLQLPAGGRRRWQFAAWLSDARRPVRVRAVDPAGRVVGETEVGLSPERAAASLVGYLGDEPPVPPRQAEGGGSRVVARLSEEDLPHRPSAYASLDLLVLERLDPTRVNADQRDALETWVLHGGRVVASGPLDPEAFPWMRLGREATAAVPATDLVSVRADAVQRLVPEPGRRPVLERGRIVAVVGAHGLGQVVRWAVPAARVPPTSPLWLLVLPRPQPQQGPPEPQPRAKAPLGTAAAWLGAYALLWFLATSFADGRLSRWLVAAPVLLVAAAGIPAVADQVRQAATVLDVRGGRVVVDGRGWARGWGFAVAPYRGPYTYTLPAASAVWVSGQFEEATVTFQPDRTVLRVWQEAGARLRVSWERVERLDPAPTVRWEQEAVLVRDAGVRAEGLVVFRGRVSNLEPAGAELVGRRWAALPASLEAVEALRWVRADADTIMEVRPVAAFPDPSSGGWRFIVGPAP